MKVLRLLPYLFLIVALLWAAANVDGPIGVWSGFFAFIVLLICGADAEGSFKGRLP